MHFIENDVDNKCIETTNGHSGICSSHLHINSYWSVHGKQRKLLLKRALKINKMSPFNYSRNFVVSDRNSLQ